MTIAQVKVACHAAHDSLFTVIEQPQMPHRTMPFCESILAVSSSWLCVWILFMWSEAESLVLGGF
jgi:hypothetical protein